MNNEIVISIVRTSVNAISLPEVGVPAPTSSFIVDLQ